MELTVKSFNAIIPQFFIFKWRWEFPQYLLLNQIKSFVLKNKNIIYYRPWLALYLLVCIVRYFPKLYMWLYRNPLRHEVIESDPAFNNSHLYRGSQRLKHSSQTVGRKNSLLIEGNQAQGGGVICHLPVGSEWKKIVQKTCCVTH